MVVGVAETVGETVDTEIGGGVSVGSCSQPTITNNETTVLRININHLFPIEFHSLSSERFWFASRLVINAKCLFYL